MNSPEDQPIGNIENFLKGEIIGQADACRVLSRAFLRGEMGYGDAGRPRSFMLLLGETGVGKTESVLSLSRFMYGSDEYVIRLDMAEFGDKKAGLARMVGESRSEQGLIADEMARVDSLLKAKRPDVRKGRILLLDEIEKAHPDVAKLFLGMEVARLRMSNNLLLDFRDTHIVATSNLGSECARELSQEEKVPYAALARAVIEEARGHFDTAVYARFTEVVVFRSLKYEVQKEICRQKLERKQIFLEKKTGSTLRIAPEVLVYLVKRGFHKSLGARMIRNAIDREVGDAFVRWELEKGLKGNLLLTVGRTGLEVIPDRGFEKGGT